MFRFALIAFLSLAVVPSADASETLDRIGRECHAQLGLGEGGCKCIQDRAADELNETQQQFLLAKVTRDQAAERALSLPVADSQEVVAFIQSAPQTCAGK